VSVSLQSAFGIWGLWIKQDPFHPTGHKSERPARGSSRAHRLFVFPFSSREMLAPVRIREVPGQGSAHVPPENDYGDVTFRRFGQASTRRISALGLLTGESCGRAHPRRLPRCRHGHESTNGSEATQRPS